MYIFWKISWSGTSPEIEYSEVHSGLSISHIVQREMIEFEPNRKQERLDFGDVALFFQLPWKYPTSSSESQHLKKPKKSTFPLD